MLAYTSNENRSPVPDETVGMMLKAASVEQGRRIALTELRDVSTGERHEWSYIELFERTKAVAAFLLEKIQPGEHLAIWAKNSPEWLFLEFGALMAGIVVVPINAGARKADLEAIVDQSDAVCLFFDPIHGDTECQEMLSSVKDQCTGLRLILSIQTIRELENVLPDWSLPTVSPDAIATLQFTSGTTGKAKGALLSHKALINTARVLEKHLEFESGSVWLNPVPLYTIAGATFVPFTAICNGGTQVLLRRFSPTDFFRAVKEERINWAPLVPTMATMLLEHPQSTVIDFSSLQIVTVGGASIPAEMVYQFEKKFGVTFCMLYGQTEACSAASHSKRKDPLEIRVRSAGKALPGRELKIVNPETREILNTGESGEICIRGHVMSGYYKLQEETERALDQDGWLYTGDIGEIWADGSLTISGRVKDMIIRGGINIYPKEIEDVLVQYPAVAEAVVFGLADPVWGEIIIAAVRMAATSIFKEDKLKEYIADQISSNKVPARIVQVTSFPVTPSGKIQKNELREFCLKSKLI